MDKKKLTSTLIIMFCVVAGTMAQERSDLKGPKHKNYKPWQHKQVEKEIVTTDRSDRKGPEAKNYKPWKVAESEVSAQVIDTKRDKDPIKGPMRKNQKAWD